MTAAGEGPRAVSHGQGGVGVPGGGGRADHTVCPLTPAAAAHPGHDSAAGAPAAQAAAAEQPPPALHVAALH